MAGELVRKAAEFLAEYDVLNAVNMAKAYERAAMVIATELQKKDNSKEG